MIKGLAHQALGETIGTFEQAANLQVDTGADLLDRPIGSDRGVLQGFNESLCRPPERTRRRRLLGGLDAGQRLEHGPAPLFGLGRLGQPAQQALLIAYTFGFEDLSQLLRRQRRSSGNPLGRTQGNIRKKEVAGARTAQSARLGEGKIDRQQTEWLIRFANHQFVEIQMNARQCFRHDRQGRLVSQQSAFLQPGKQRFQGFSHLSDAVQPDDRQRAMHLVNMGAAEFELGGVRPGLVKAKSLPGALQRQINLALDPGQGAQIEFSCRVHHLSRSISVSPP